MTSHAPSGYCCPFCRNAREGTSDHRLEILHNDGNVVVKMNPRWWPNNPGSALVFPTAHYENIYDLPPALGTPIQEAAWATAGAMKRAYGCDGVSTRQHNEPAGSQDVWHYHLHVFPRWDGDDLYRTTGEWADPQQISAMARQLRAAWPTEPPPRLPT